MSVGNPAAKRQLSIEPRDREAQRRLFNDTEAQI